MCCSTVPLGGGFGSGLGSTLLFSMKTTQQPEKSVRNHPKGPRFTLDHRRKSMYLRTICILAVFCCGCSDSKKRDYQNPKITEDSAESVTRPTASRKDELKLPTQDQLHGVARHIVFNHVQGEGMRADWIKWHHPFRACDQEPACVILDKSSYRLTGSFELALPEGELWCYTVDVDWPSTEPTDCTYSNLTIRNWGWREWDVDFQEIFDEGVAGMNKALEGTGLENSKFVAERVSENILRNLPPDIFLARDVNGYCVSTLNSEMTDNVEENKLHE